ncbi:hypothetical protein JCM10213_009255 [Rhodosporidiobolus nylandii]
MGIKTDKRSSSQRRSLLPSLRGSTNKADAASSASRSAAAHRRTVSAPFSSTSSGSLPRSRTWLTSLLKPPDDADPVAPAPPPKDAPLSRPQRRSYQPGMGSLRDPPRGGVWDTDAGKENQKPLPPMRALSPNLQHRLASLDRRGSLPPKRASWQDATDTAGEEIFSGQDVRSRWPSQEALHEPAFSRRDDGVQASRISSTPYRQAPRRSLSGAPALEAFDPSKSYLDVPAITSASTEAVSFANPFTSFPPQSDYTSALLPPRPPSSSSFVPHLPASRPPLSIDPHLPPSRKPSNLSASVYSAGGSFSDEGSGPETAGPVPPLRSYFSPITPADLSTPLSGLAISCTATPVASPPRSPAYTRHSRLGSGAASRPLPYRLSSTSSQSTAISTRASPLFDTRIFSAPSSVLTAASSSFDRNSPLPPDKPFFSSPFTAAKTQPSRSATSSPLPHDNGTWRQDWSINAPLSRYVHPDDRAALFAKEQPPEMPDSEASDSDRELTREEELEKIERYCRREIDRRRRERHQRYLDERLALYGEEEAQVVFGAAA